MQSGLPALCGIEFKMRVFIFFVFYLSANFLSSSAWLAPERCQQSSRRRRFSAQANNNITVVPVIEYTPGKPLNYNEVINSINTPVKAEFDIMDLAERQENQLKEKYKNYEFASIPVRGHRYWRNDGPNMTHWLELYSPYNCRFKTHRARSLSSVFCHDLNCNLVHTVSTVDTYTASEGYNWGVKYSSKFAIIPAVFEVGGEVSTGGTYSCTYTKGKTTTETVGCAVGPGKIGNLQLYLVKSDMQCDIGKVKMETDVRDGKHEVSWTHKDYLFFDYDEVIEIRESAAFKITCDHPIYNLFGDMDCPVFNTYMIDVSKISERVLNKIKVFFPYFNPYTDTISIQWGIRSQLQKFGSTNELDKMVLMKVRYYKKASSERDHGITVPFTNENGDSVFQYACILSAIQ